MMRELQRLGRQIYDLSNWREKRRYWTFCIRVARHRRKMQELYDWFRSDSQRAEMLADNPFPIEQVTRGFFYAGSTFEERLALVKNHFILLQKIFKPDYAVRLGKRNAEYVVWESPYEDICWNAMLNFEEGQRKEGLLVLKMTLGREDLYQMMFWLGYDKRNEPSLYIGAMQGPNMENARDVVKEITKRSHRYRTKNLILYMTQAVARSIGMKHIYAVSNSGYYANNHLRLDRKLKTDFGEFWAEAGGTVTGDERFYEIPLVETRKTEAEIPTRKRAVYRKRFAFQDEADRQIEEKLRDILN